MSIWHFIIALIGVLFISAGAVRVRPDIITGLLFILVGVVLLMAGIGPLVGVDTPALQVAA